ncbi:hypothetical protein AAG906_021231 [Vitis piasezkii]
MSFSLYSPTLLGSLLRYLYLPAISLSLSLNLLKALRPSHQSSSLSSNGSYGRALLPTGVPSSSYKDLRFGFNGTRSLIPLAYMFSDGYRMYPNNMAETLIHFGILGCTDIACKIHRRQDSLPRLRFTVTMRRYWTTPIDAMYVPLLTSLHLKWAVLATEKKKHLDKILEALELDDGGMVWMEEFSMFAHAAMDKLVVEMDKTYAKI